jgi:hypothetical protein
MKLTRVRYFSPASIILICCCISIAFAVSAAAASFSFRIGLSFRQQSSSGTFVPCNDLRSGQREDHCVWRIDGTGYLNDTWSFDGTSWTQIATQSAPPARAAAQMTYDSVSSKGVLFGGLRRNQLPGRHMALGWVDVTVDAGDTPASPSAVTGPMLFPDPNGRADLFGGFDGQFYQLTMWQWNGSDWTQLFPPTVPLLGLQRPLQRIRPRDRLLCLAVSLMLTRITPGPMMARHGPAISGCATSLSVCRFCRFRPRAARSGSLWRWKRRCRPEHDVVMGSGCATWTHLSTPQSPPAREGAGMTYDAALQRVILSAVRITTDLSTIPGN